jgi:cytochrome c-type biogenesis protein CcmE
MDRRRLKFLGLAFGIVTTMTFLLVVGIRGGMVYYVTVSEFVENGAIAGDNFRINGKVQPGSIERLPGGSRVLFIMTEGAENLPVDYEGIIPDTFVDDADVVVHGALQADGTFRADELLAKCPSKYEAADGVADYAEIPSGV